eukprot:2735303-Rhodomonas_salina.3
MPGTDAAYGAPDSLWPVRGARPRVGPHSLRNVCCTMAGPTVCSYAPATECPRYRFELKIVPKHMLSGDTVNPMVKRGYAFPTVLHHSYAQSGTDVAFCTVPRPLLCYMPWLRAVRGWVFCVGLRSGSRGTRSISFSRESALAVRVHDTRTDASQIWTREKFMDRIYAIRDYYHRMVVGDDEDEADVEDPFFDEQESHLVGTSLVYLDSLYYLFDVDMTTPIIDYKVRVRASVWICCCLVCV